jgi:hypothetical protein
VQYLYVHQGERPEREFSDARLVSADGRFFDTGLDGLPDSAEQGRTGLEAGPDLNLDDAALPGGTENDGLFQEGELLADDGHRALFTPRLGAPLRLLDAVELYPEVGWYETLYGSDAQGFERRGFLTGRADLRTRLRRRYGEISHLLEPRLGWALVTDVSQSGNPLYVPATAVPQRRVRQLDLENVTRDRADRVEEFNALTLALGNRLYQRPGAPGEAAVPLADFVLSGQYDFAQEEFGGVFLDGRLFPFAGATARLGLGFDPEQAELDEGLAGLAFRDERGDRFSLEYRYLREVPRFFEAFPQENPRFDGFSEEFERVNQVALGFRIALNPQWGLAWRGAYSFERGLLLGNLGALEYISKCRCWALRLEVSQSRGRGVGVGVRYAFTGLGDDSRAPFESAEIGSDAGFLEGL